MFSVVLCEGRGETWLGSVRAYKSMTTG